jgi:hypothetical protein
VSLKLSACGLNGQVFSWRTTLSANVFNTSPRLSIPRLHTDYIFSLLTYAFALSNLAFSVVLSLGDYEHEAAISDSERKSKDEKLNHAVTFLTKASGLFTFVSDSALPDWEKSQGSVAPGFVRPPELMREVNTALSKYTSLRCHVV